MTKHHWRQQIKSFFESHADPDTHERLKQSRKEMEEKKDKIIKLIKIDGSNSKSESLEELVKDYHKQYESLYDVHLNLTGELKKKAHRKDTDDKEKYSSSSSDSDSESSSKKKTKIQDLESKLEKLRQYEIENAELRTKVADLERKPSQSNDQMLIELQTTIEDLKRDLDTDKDELTTIEEKNRNLEVMLRMSNQKKRVTEQLLSEKEDKNVALSQTVDEYGGMIKEISKNFNNSLADFELGVKKKLDEDYGELVKSVTTLSNEVESIKRWIKVSKSGKDASSLDLEMERVVKEKNERIMSLEEEKREAIRQLCVWSDYYKSRCVELEGVILKMDPQMKNVTLMH